MSKSPDSRIKKVLSGLLRQPIPASLFTTGIVLTYGYASGLIFSIGDTKQLIPIFLGIILGSVVFSLLGFVIRLGVAGLIYVTAISVVLLAASYVLIIINSLALNSIEMVVVAFLMGSPATPVSLLVRNKSRDFSRSTRLMFGSLQAMLVILFIFAYSLIYELQGQVNLYLGPLIFLVISLLYLLVAKVV